MAKFTSTIPSLIVMGASGTIRFNKGEYQTSNKAEIKDIESTPSFQYGEIVRVEEEAPAKTEKSKDEPKEKETPKDSGEPKTVSPQV